MNSKLLTGFACVAVTLAFGASSLASAAGFDPFQERVRTPELKSEASSLPKTFKDAQAALNSGNPQKVSYAIRALFWMSPGIDGTLPEDSDRIEPAVLVLPLKSGILTALKAGKQEDALIGMAKLLEEANSIAESYAVYGEAEDLVGYSNQVKATWSQVLKSAAQAGVDSESVENLFSGKTGHRGSLPDSGNPSVETVKKIFSAAKSGK